MKTEIQTVTPQKAQEWLCKNHFNRPIRKANVITFADQMKSGRWLLSHQGIAFDTSGRLIDGQHRLNAVILANTPVAMMVTTGASIDLFKVTDGGAKRNLSDHTMLDERLAESCAFIIRHIFQEHLNTNRTIDPESAILLANSDFGQIHQKLIEFHGSKKGRTFPSAASRSAAVAQVIISGDVDHVFQSYKSLVSMDFDSMNSASKSIFKSEYQGKNGSAGGYKLELFCKMFKVYDPKYKDLKVLRITPSEIDVIKDICRTFIKF